MELAGKALKDFWIWYLLPEQQKEYKTNSLIKFGNENSAKVRFLAMSFTERYGVFVDFFDSINIVIEDCKNHRINSFYFMVNGELGIIVNTRNESRIEAVKKANEIYNYENYR